MSVRLELRTAPSVPLEAGAIRPDALAALVEVEIARLPVRHGREEARLADFFQVEGGRSDDVRVAGDLSKLKHVGAAMTAGSLLVEGRVGMHAGAGMQGGVLRIEGGADDWAGAEMCGGLLDIRGPAGAHLGGAYAGSARGMRGGMILVHGAAGDDAGVRLRRGTIAVRGSAGERAGAHMIAGTLAVFGELGAAAGLCMKRGTILAGGSLELLPTFRYSCTDRPGFLALLFRSLQRHGFDVPERVAGGAFRRYAGDFIERGRGEILQWTSA